MATVFVGNLSPEATDSDLRGLFEAYGRITSVRIAHDRRGRAREFAHVELEPKAAAAAVEALRGVQLKGRTLDVTLDESRGGGSKGRRKSGFRRRR